MATSLFQPVVLVDDDGTVSVDWSDAYVSTDASGHDGIIRTEYAEPAGQPHSSLLDGVLALAGPRSPTPAEQAAALRRLADHIETISTGD